MQIKGELILCRNFVPLKSWSVGDLSRTSIFFNTKIVTHFKITRGISGKLKLNNSVKNIKEGH